jgi:Xaa-Pro aminopeptidase
VTELRRQRLAATLIDHGVDAILVTRLVNVRYLTGFTGSNAALLVTPAGVVLATDGRYTTQAAEQAADVERLINRECAAALVAKAVEQAVGRLGFEAHDVSVEQHGQLVELAGGMALRPLTRVVETMRAVKDEAEIELLRTACTIGDTALRELLPTIAVGRSEREIARELEARMLDHGADAAAFETIVATGPNSAVPHHRPTDRRVAAGDFLKIDFGARLRGYHADCTRTVVVGANPTDWQREIYGVVREAQRAGRHALAPAVDVRAVDAAARDVVIGAGYGEQFSHGLGHGVGLEIHEAPLLATEGTGRLADRTPVTIEPGIYLPGRGGVRIEDTLVVRHGGPELLTTIPKDLLVL